MLTDWMGRGSRFQDKRLRLQVWVPGNRLQRSEAQKHWHEGSKTIQQLYEGRNKEMGGLQNGDEQDRKAQVGDLRDQDHKRKSKGEPQRQGWEMDWRLGGDAEAVYFARAAQKGGQEAGGQERLAAQFIQL